MRYKVMLLGGPLDGKWKDVPLEHLARGRVEFAVYEQIPLDAELDLTAVIGKVVNYRLPYPRSICLEYIPDQQADQEEQHMREFLNQLRGS